MREQKREYRIAHYLNFSLIKNKLKQLTKMPTPTPYKGQRQRHTKAKNANETLNSVVKIFSLTIETKQ